MTTSYYALRPVVDSKHIRVRVLDMVEVEVDGAPVGIAGEIPRRVVAALWVSRPRGRTTSQLIDDVWFDQPPASASASLRNIMTRLRRLCGADFIDSRGGVYRLGDHVGDDVADLTAALASSSAGAIVGEAEPILAGLAGVPFGDLDLPVLEAERQRLGDLVGRSRVRLAEALATQGAIDRAVVVAEDAVAERPFDEAAIGLLMRVLYIAGRQQQALEVYQRARQRFIEDLGLEPSPLLRSVESAVLVHDPALLVGTSESQRLVPASLLTRRAGRFVGRTELVDRLLGRLQELSPNAPGAVVVVEGAPGLGKTAVAAEVAIRARDLGARVLYASGVEMGADAGAVFGELTDELFESPPPEGTHVWGPTVLRAIATAATRQPVLAVVDDAQWLDGLSASLATRLASRAMPNVLLMIIARPVAPGGAPWSVCRRAVKDFGHVEIVDVGPLDRSSLMALVAEELGSDSAPGAAAELADAAGGNPFAARSLARHRLVSAASADPAGSDAAADTLAEVLAEVLAGIEPFALGLLATAATVGREADVRLVAHAAGSTTAEVGAALGAVAGRGIVTITEGRTVGFTHDLWRDAAAVVGSADDRRSRHLRVAEAILGHAPRLAHQHAQHLRAAVPLVAVPAAVDASLRVGADLARAGAHADAAREFEAGLALVDSTVDPGTEVQLRTRLAESLMLGGRYERGREEAVSASEIARLQGDWEGLAGAALAATLHGRNVRSDLVATGLLDQALTVEQTAATRVALLARRAAMRVVGQPSEREHDLVDEAAALAASIDDRRCESMVLRARLATLEGRPVVEGSAELTERLCRLDVGSPGDLADALARRSGSLLTVGLIAEAEHTLDHLTSVLALSGHPRLVWIQAVQRAEIAQLRGNFDEADRIAQAALELGTANEIDDAPGSYAAFTWMAWLLHGQVAALADATKHFADHYDAVAWHLGHALCLAWGGDTTAPDLVVAGTERLGEEARDLFWPLALAIAMEATLTCGTFGLAPRLLDLAAPYEGEWPQLGAGGSTIGPIDRLRAGLSAASGDVDAAAHLFDRASAQCRDAGAVPWTLWTRYDRAVLLDRDADAARSCEAAIADIGVVPPRRAGLQT